MLSGVERTKRTLKSLLKFVSFINIYYRRLFKFLLSIARYVIFSIITIKCLHELTHSIFTRRDHTSLLSQLKNQIKKFHLTPSLLYYSLYRVMTRLLFSTLALCFLDWVTSKNYCLQPSLRVKSPDLVSVSSRSFRPLKIKQSSSIVSRSICSICKAICTSPHRYQLWSLLPM